VLNEADFYEVVSKVLEIDSSALRSKLEVSLEDLGWDSLSSLEFLAKLDSQFDFQFDASSISEELLLGDLLSLIVKN
jgi:acyl carrier protein